jgi:putative Holliday junction resolvase
MYLGVDWGTKRIGLAIGQEIPYELATLENNSEIFQKISKLCDQEKIERIIVGMPVLPSGDPNENADKIEDFGRKLKEITKRPIFFESENLTTQTALDLLKEEGASPKGIEDKVDQMAARLILEQYIANKEDSSQEDL